MGRESIPARQQHQQRLRVLPGGKAAAPPGLTDDELIRAFEHGEQKTAGALYDRLINVVEATLFRVLGSRSHDHDDLVQSAFEQIMLTLMRGRFGRGCSLDSWASSVTSHVALNAIRSRVRDRRHVARECDVEWAADNGFAQANSERQQDARDTLENVRRHLADMNPDKAKTLLLHDVLGHDLAEIAELTRVTTSAAQSRLVRARRELQERLAEDARKKGGEP